MKHLHMRFCLILAPFINLASYTYFVIKQVIVFMKLYKLMTL